MTGNEMALMASIAVDMRDKEVNDVLDKIISEATSLKISYTDHDKDTYRRGVNDAVKIIDKYKAESEE